MTDEFKENSYSMYIYVMKKYTTQIIGGELYPLARELVNSTN